MTLIDYISSKIKIDVFITSSFPIIFTLIHRGHWQKWQWNPQVWQWNPQVCFWILSLGIILNLQKNLFLFYSGLGILVHYSVFDPLIDNWERINFSVPDIAASTSERFDGQVHILKIPSIPTPRVVAPLHYPCSSRCKVWMEYGFSSRYTDHFWKDPA